MAKYRIGLIILFIGAATLTAGCQEQNYGSFAQCLTEKGAVMYGAYWCGHCKEQKEMFGDSFKYINYVECTEKKQICEDAGIGGYPTWIIDGKSHEGVQPLSKLAGISQCKL